jgi:hypothetical protein
MPWQVPETKKRKRERNFSQALACRLSFYMIGHQSIDYTKRLSLKQEQFFSSFPLRLRTIVPDYSNFNNCKNPACTPHGFSFQTVAILPL